MASEVYARIRSTSKYHGQDEGIPFPVSLNVGHQQLANGFYIQGGPGGNYRPEDLDFYTKKGEEFHLVKRKSRVK
ncbi:MAG: hypothetical protein JKY42_11715 [Flavobacteriales bacterium]|nr:hypothetical protein [Flavobacteriales bacterium]